MPTTSPVYWIYNELYKIFQENNDCWVTQAFALFQEFNNLSYIGFDEFKNMWKLQVKKTLKLYLKDDYAEKWSAELGLCTSENNKKLRTHKDFKTTFEFEPYLKVQCPKCRIAISKLRMSAHNLAIEVGRHKSQSPADRLCATCNVPETELHHVLECSEFDVQRNKLLEVCWKEIYRFDSLRQERKFIKIMEEKSVNLANALGQYLVQSNDAKS